MSSKSRSALRLAAGGAAIAAVLVLSGPVPGQSAGEKVYKAKCAMCHAPDGSGNTPAGKAMKAPDLCCDEVKKSTNAAWTEIIVKGKKKMPAFDKKLTDAEIKDVVAYVRRLCKK